MPSPCGSLAVCAWPWLAANSEPKSDMLPAGLLKLGVFLAACDVSMRRMVSGKALSQLAEAGMSALRLVTCGSGLAQSAFEALPAEAISLLMSAFGKAAAMALGGEQSPLAILVVISSWIFTWQETKRRQQQGHHICTFG